MVAGRADEIAMARIFFHATIVAVLILAGCSSTHRVDASADLSAPIFPATRPAVLQITPAGTYLWNSQPVSFEEIQARFATGAKLSPQPEVRITPDPHAPYKSVARVMSLAQHAGMTKLGIIGGTQ
jgi:biopolymer transport protein ExbD